jgi:aconitate hydratase
MARDRQVDAAVSFDINPTSRQMLENLAREGHLAELIHAGARSHQAGCNGCMGMGQAPATGKNSLRTTPRNFPGRSGNKEDSVFLCSPETAAAAALTGKITDPRDLGLDYPQVKLPPKPVIIRETLTAPLTAREALAAKLEKGPNITSLPEISALADSLEVPVLLKMGDDVSTDAISPAGARALPFRSNIQRIADFCFEIFDETYAARAKAVRDTSGHALIAGFNYGQGSSREHAALAPRYLGLRLMVAKSFARIHAQNLPNAGILPLTFVEEADYARIEQGDILIVRNIRETVRSTNEFEIEISGKAKIRARHSLSPRQVQIMLAGGLINWVRARNVARASQTAA